MLIDGIFVPLLEPFYRDGRSYQRKLEASAARYSLTPAAGLVALPPGGEASALSDAEVVESLRTVGETAAAAKVLIAGAERDSVRGALAIAGAAEAAGFDALLLAPPPSWTSLTRENGRTVLSLFFRAVADASPLPVLLWSAADNGCVLNVEEVAELATHTNIVGLVDGGLTVERLRAIASATESRQREVTVTPVFAAVTRRMLTGAQATTGPATFVSAESLGGGGAALAVAPAQPAMKTRTKTVGFQVMAAGDCSGLVTLLEVGLTAAMPRLASCAPQATHEVWAAFKDGNPALAAEKQRRLQAADELLREMGVAGVKYAADLNGYFGGLPRLPRLPLTSQQRQGVEKAMANLRN